MEKDFPFLLFCVIVNLVCFALMNRMPDQKTTKMLKGRGYHEKNILT